MLLTRIIFPYYSQFDRNLRLMSMIHFKSVLLFLGIFIFSSCSTATNMKSEEDLFQNQENLKTFLENIAEYQEYYSIQAYARKTQVGPPFRRTRLFTHSFYLLDLDDGEYHTLSFSNTRSIFHQEGAWILNRNTDLASYRTFIQGNNRWRVEDIFPGETINPRQTLINVIDNINNGTSYYYYDHMKSKPNSQNCNTALYLTTVLSAK